MFDSLGKSIKLVETKVNLTSYTGQRLNIAGKCCLKVIHKDKYYELEFYVVKAKAPCILGLSDSIALNLIQKVDTIDAKIGSALNQDRLGFKSNRPTEKNVTSHSNEILNEYPDLMYGIGCIKGTHKIVLRDNAVPVIHPARKDPIALRLKLKHKLDSLENLGIIEKVSKPTEWVQSLVIVHEQNGDLRLCLDPKQLNAAIMRPHFQIPSFEEITSKMSGAKFFSTLDSRNGFWHVMLDEQSSELTTFNTPYGRFKFLRLPYGLCSASEVFQQKMKQIFEGFEGVEVYIDDLIIWGSSKSEHDLRLRRVLEKMTQENIKLNKNKCRICIKEISYLGFKFTENGIDVDE